MRRRRYKAYQEQNLARTAVAAGASFGWTEPAQIAADEAEWASRKRIANFYMPMLFAAPFVSSLAYYFVG